MKIGRFLLKCPCRCSKNQAKFLRGFAVQHFQNHTRTDCKSGLPGILPGPWQTTWNALKVYRQRLIESDAVRLSLREEFWQNRSTIFASCVIILGTSALKGILGSVSVGFGYVLGCAIPTLVINRRWGTFAALLCTATVTLARLSPSFDPAPDRFLLWNIAMRFWFFQIYVFLFDFVRLDMKNRPETDD